MYHEYATTVASVMMSPRSSAVVGERPGAGVTGGLYQTGHERVYGDAGGAASRAGLQGQTARDTTPACTAPAGDRMSRQSANRHEPLPAVRRRQRGPRTDPHGRGRPLQ